MKTAILVFLIFLLAVPASAHSGRTDSNGGHWDRSAGEYHYHHGYPAHQHSNGECPYENAPGQNVDVPNDAADNKDRVQELFEKQGREPEESKSASEKEKTNVDIAGYVLTGGLVMWVVGSWICATVSERKNHK